MAKVVAGFHARDEDWIIRRKLYALSQFCDHIVVVLDKCTDDTEAICREFPKVQIEKYERELCMPDNGDDGPICEEGRMRQLTWNLCAAYKPDWIVLGDADEIPSPSAADFMAAADPSVDVYYLKMVNLYKHPQQYIGGQYCAWSPDFAHANRKGVICRWRPGVEYRYDLSKTRHTRLEPNPVNPFRAIEDERHILLSGPMLVHWKWVHWERWRRSVCYSNVKYQDYFRGMELKPTRREWLWSDEARPDDSSIVLHAWNTV